VATQAQITAKKNLILIKLGEQDSNSGPIAPNIDAIWEGTYAQGGDDLELQTNIVLLECWDIFIASVMRGEYVPVGTQHKPLEDKLTFYRQMRDAVQAKIDKSVVIATINLDIYEPTPTGY
jgi:exonuclease III